jgi:hypothetical protein
MFCPSCGQEKVSPDTNFCSRCGYLLSGTAELLQTGGVIPQPTAAKCSSPRAKGVKQAVFIFFLAIVIPALIGVIAIALGFADFWFPLVLTAAVILVFNGLLRLAYALNFQEGSPAAGKDDFLTAAQTHMARPASVGVLPPQQTYPAEQFSMPVSGNRHETSDLEPRSVTEGTTKLLENEERP